MTVVVILLALVLIPTAALLATRMPGESQRGPLPPPTAAEQDLAARLEQDVRHLALGIGVRDIRSADALVRTRAWIEDELSAAGHAVERQRYRVGPDMHENLIVELPGTQRADEILVLGAHYDTAPGTPGANDNGSGVAALLALARLLPQTQRARTVRLVFFDTEEPPSFGGPDMGSRHNARRARAREERIVAMLALETLGYYDDTPGSQSYPPLVGALYPPRGDFLAVVGNPRSRALVRRVVGTFRGAVAFPCEGGALPSFLPGVGWSDHSSFWAEGFSAVMLTDTAPFRDAAYHTAGDLPERLDYQRLARVVFGIRAVVEDLAAGE